MKAARHPASKKLPPFLCAWLAALLCHGATFTVTTIADTGAGSLRQAIASANTNSGPNNIVFQISGTAPFTIIPKTVLPSVGNPTVIDGTTQTGYNGAPLVELDGASAGNVFGLQLLAGHSTVRGLAINRFAAQAILLTGSSNVVAGNYIGTDVTGAKADANGSFGIWVTSAGNLIGGTNSGDGNVIAGGNDTGIYISSAGGGNIIQGNLIGVTASGTKALGNVNNGIVLDGSSGNSIGGTNSAARNVISGNGQSGIYLNTASATGNLIQGNYIGLNLAGSSALNNADDGITLNGAPGNTISGNVISGNGFSGISLNLATASNNVVWGNLIGTDALGRIAVANQNSGVTISAGTGNTLGGTNIGAGAGNVISGNKQDGIFLTDGASGNLIQGNLVGLAATGATALPNGFNGISLSGAVSNIIGGTVTGSGNVISGNVDNGVGILLLSDSGNVVLGNRIGTDITGHTAIANTQAGVRIQGCSNVIGGIVSGSGNVISGNGQQGVWLTGTAGNVTGNAVEGNLIGVDATGANSLPNANAGVGISSASANQIGAVGAGNVISANGDAGVFFIGAGTTGNQMQGNYIGTDSSGTLARGNLFEGIYLQDGTANLIGGSTAGAGNVISGNNTRGFWLTNASRNVIQGNYIGTQADGISALGNTYHGIDLDVNATNNTVGGATAGAGNHIAFAKTVYAGVRVRNGSVNNLISGNSIFSNGALGIDLGNNGVNSIFDCESGIPAGTANAGQNFPVLSDAYCGNGTRIRGTLDSGSGKTYLLQFFASPVGDPSGYGEGQVFLGQANFTLGVNCSSNFTVVLPVSVPANWAVTATATSPANNTSEFSAWVPVVTVPAIQLVSGSSQQGQFSFSWTNNGGSFGLQQTYSLSPPVIWTAAVTKISLTNNNFVAIIPTTNSSVFYRLAAQ